MRKNYNYETCKPFESKNLKGFFYASGASQQTRRTVNPFPSGVVGAAPTWRNSYFRGVLLILNNKTLGRKGFLWVSWAGGEPRSL